VAQATALFAALHVADIGAARAWYERLMDRPPDLVPNDVEACWTVTDTGWIYLMQDAGRAGTSLATVLIDDLHGHVAQLDARGVTHGPVETNGAGVLTVWVTDPDGNRLQFGQPPAG
jgi:hypothetical protein